MSWIAEYDTRGREFPACVHVTKTTDFMTHGATYVPIEDGKAVRDENARLREVVADGELHAREVLAENAKLRELLQRLLAEYRYLRVRPRKMYLQHEQRMRAIEDEMCELGIEVDE